MYLLKASFGSLGFVQKDNNNNKVTSGNISVIEDCIIRPSVCLAVTMLLTSAEALNV